MDADFGFHDVEASADVAAAAGFTGVWWLHRRQRDV